MSKAAIETGKYWQFGWKLVEGCTRVSSACKNCWSLAQEKRFGGPPEGQIVLHPERLNRPLKRRKPASYAIWNDLFHPDVPVKFMQQAFGVMEQATQHIFLILTKRPGIMYQRYHPALGGAEHIWLGVTVEEQEYDSRIKELLKIPAAVRFVSLEPMLGLINLRALNVGTNESPPVFYNSLQTYKGHPGLDWVIVGGETGLHQRRCDDEWILSIIRQCDEENIPVFVKAFPMPDGRISKDMNEWPEWARRRVFPKCTQK